MNDLIWSDNIYVEENKAWFVSIKANALFQIDMKEEQCRCLVSFPDFRYPDFRRNPRCLKCDDLIYAFPDFGDRIWVYNLRTGEISDIEVENPLNVRLRIYNFWKENDVIYAVVRGLNEILEINIDEYRIVNHYKIPYDGEFIYGDCKKLDKRIFVLIKNRIYEFNIQTKIWEINTIPGISDELTTLAYEEGVFFLTGLKEIIYIWKKQETIIKDFSINFNESKDEKSIECGGDRFEDPFFISSIESKDYIWFIPYKASQILYLDKKTNDINIFEIKEDEEYEKKAKRVLATKYLVLYSKPNQVIGLYSCKSKMLIEINIESLKWKYKDIQLDMSNFVEIMANNHCIWRESDTSLYDFLSICKNKKV